MQEFLDPKSMLTPGVAGTFMMFLVNGIVDQFPELSPRFTALVISFLIGAMVFYSHRLLAARIYEKGTFWVLNSLIVFVVGFGATHIAADASRAPIAGLFVTSAIAQDSNQKDEKAKPPAREPTKAEGAAESAALEKRLVEVEAENAKLREQVRNQKANAMSRGETGFFKRW